MRWRVLGFERYARELSVALIRWAIAFSIFGLLLGTGRDSRWQGRIPALLTFSAGGGLAMRLLIELIPGWVEFRRGKIEHRRGSLRHRWPVRACNEIRWTEVNGLVRLDVDAVSFRGKPFGDVLPVPLKRADEVRRLIAKEMASDWQDNRITPAEFGTGSQGPSVSEASPVLGYAPKAPPPSLMMRLSFLIGVNLILLSLLAIAVTIAMTVNGRPFRSVAAAGAMAALSVSGAVIAMRRAFRF
jgi:hypothetical protein